jgi:hypothetical protein
LRTGTFAPRQNSRLWQFLLQKPLKEVVLGTSDQAKLRTVLVGMQPNWRVLEALLLRWRRRDKSWEEAVEALLSDTG